MLLDNKMNPFARSAPAGMENKQPEGILNIEAPAAPVMQDDPSMVEQGIGLAKDKALNVAMDKGTEMATSAATKAVAGAGKGGAAAGGAGAAGAAGTGLMAAAAPMAAPLLIGGLLAAKLFK